MPYQHGWLVVLNADGSTTEIINHARTTAYLSGVTFDNGVSICDVLADGGCAAYAYQPPCGLIDGHLAFAAGGAHQAKAADEPAFDITGVLRVTVRVAPADWTPTTSQTIVSRMESTGPSNAWRLWLQTDGTLMFSHSSDGSAVSNAQSTADLSALGAAVWRWLRVTYTPGAVGVRNVVFETSTDGYTWTPFGATVTSGVLASIAASVAELEIGSYNDGTNPLTGDVSDVILEGDGVVIFEMRSTDITTDGLTSVVTTSGHTVTLTGTTVTTETVARDDDDWRLIPFTTPAADDAPWYSTAYPESGDAFGFWIEDWTGLDDAHINRPVTQVGELWGGAQLGAIRARERVMKLNVILFARNEEASEYLFRWLATVLSSVCSTCAVDSILIRRICPTNGDLWKGVVRLDEVGLVEGVHWENDPTTQSMCSVRRVSFTLAAGDPCLYVDTGTAIAPVATAVVADCLDNLETVQGGFTLDRTPCRPICSELIADCRTVITFDVGDTLGATAPIVTLSNDNDEHSLAVRLICYGDPNEIGIAAGPCGLPMLGELYLRPLPPWSTLRWDVSARQVEYHDHTTGTFVPGWPYVSPNDLTLRRFFVLPCGQVHVVIEPANFCYETADDGSLYDGSFNYYDPHFPTATLTVGERIGCV